MGVLAATTNAADVLDGLRRESPQLAPFLAPDFSPVDFACSALRAGESQATAARLSDGLGILGRALRTEVVGRHDELLGQVKRLKDSESALAVVHTGLETLQASIARVRAEVAEPYRQIRARTHQLASLSATVDLLRRVVRVVKLMTRLRDQLAASAAAGASGGAAAAIAATELAAAAKTVAEAEAGCRDADVASLDIIRGQRTWLDGAASTLRAQAAESLASGMASSSQAEVASTLQVYYNLGELGPRVAALTGQHAERMTAAVASALDVARIGVAAAATGSSRGGVGSPAPAGSAARWAEVLWSRLSACIDAVGVDLLSLWHLERVLAKKRDAVTGVLFADAASPTCPVNEGWSALTGALGAHLQRVMASTPSLHEALVSSYPRLLALLDALVSRIRAGTAARGAPPGVTPSHRSALLDSVAPAQAAYLHRSAARLADAQAALFPGGGQTVGPRTPVPSSSDVAKLCVRVTHELALPGGHPLLTAAVATGAAAALTAFADRCESAAAVGPELKSLGGPPTSAQLRNAALAAILADAADAVDALQHVVPPGAWSVLQRPAAALRALAKAALSPTFRSLGESLESRLCRIHTQPGWGGDDGPGVSGQPSAYLGEVTRALASFRGDILSKYPHVAAGGLGPVVTSLLETTAVRVLTLFVRHATLIRPLSEAGKLALTRDCAELELAVSTTLVPLADAPPGGAVAGAYRALRALRPLLFLDTAALAASGPPLSDLPPSAVLHHCYSRAPPELVSPAGRAGLTAVQYTAWLEQHSEEEAWRGVQATLRAYAQQAKVKGGPAWSEADLPPVFKAMLAIGEAHFGKK